MLGIWDARIRTPLHLRPSNILSTKTSSRAWPYYRIEVSKSVPIADYTLGRTQDVRGCRICTKTGGLALARMGGPCIQSRFTPTYGHWSSRKGL